MFWEDSKDRKCTTVSCGDELEGVWILLDEPVYDVSLVQTLAHSILVLLGAVHP